MLWRGDERKNFLVIKVRIPRYNDISTLTALHTRRTPKVTPRRTEKLVKRVRHPRFSSAYSSFI